MISDLNSILKIGLKLNTMKPLNSGQLRVLKNVRRALLGGNLKKIVTFGSKRFVRYSWHVRYLVSAIERFHCVNKTLLFHCIELGSKFYFELKPN